MNLLLLEKVYLVITLIFTGIISYMSWSWRSNLRDSFFLGIASGSILVYVIGIHLFYDGYPLMETIIIAESVFALLASVFIRYSYLKKRMYIAFAVLLSVGLLIYEHYASNHYSAYNLSLPTLVIASSILFAVLLFMMYRTKQFKKLASLVGIVIFANVLLYYSNKPEMLLAAILMKGMFYVYFLEFLKSVITADMKAPIQECEKMTKEFDDAVKKAVNKHMFYLELSKDKIKEKSKIDDLTRAFNKKAMIDTMEKMIEEEQSFSIMMFDIDKFKIINDTLGHVFGDKILKILANIARQSLRDKDIFGRFGGDEFIVILPKTNIKETMVVAERLRTNVEKTKNKNYTLTISIGLANYPDDAMHTKALMEHADTGLYMSKERGRNRTSHKETSETTYFKGNL